MSTSASSHTRATSDADAQLVRGIGLWGATMLAIGSVIGSGIFLTTGIMLQELPSTTLVLTATSWIGLAVLFVGKRRIPQCRYVQEKGAHTLPY